MIQSKDDGEYAEVTRKIHVSACMFLGYVPLRVRSREVNFRFADYHARSAHFGVVAVSLRVQQTAADSHPDP